MIPREALTWRPSGTSHLSDAPAFWLWPSDSDGDPEALAASLVQTCSEFEHLREGDAVIHTMMRSDPKNRQERQVLGECYMPGVTGSLSSLFDFLLTEIYGEWPDFLILLDATWWMAADARQREILMFHELMHAGQKKDEFGSPKFTRDGKEVWCIQGHDLEEFNAVVEKYGVWKTDIGAFLAAAANGTRVTAPDRAPLF